jgi:pimeloyl-ACP methyl ester carboxylesterase
MRETNGGGAAAAGAGEQAQQEHARNGGRDGTLPMSEHTIELEGIPVFWRSAPQAGSAPPLYLHGVPTSADEWGVPPRPAAPPKRRRRRSPAPPPEATSRGQRGFLGRTGGLAPDLPGFGRSGKPGDRSYTIDEYAGFIERWLDYLGVDQVQLVLHDWGAVGLAFAQRHPERLRALVLIDAVPFLPGFRWHWVARVWQTPGLGELAMGSTTRGVLRIITRQSNVTPGPMPAAWRESVLAHFDQGTQRAILRLYRSAPSEVLADAGAALGTLAVPSLVVWGDSDPYIPVRFAHEYARVLPNAQLEVLEHAGHWPWLDRPETIDRVCSFLAAN